MKTPLKSINEAGTVTRDGKGPVLTIVMQRYSVCIMDACYGFVNTGSIMHLVSHASIHINFIMEGNFV